MIKSILVSLSFLEIKNFTPGTRSCSRCYKCAHSCCCMFWQFGTWGKGGHWLVKLCSSDLTIKTQADVNVQSASLHFEYRQQWMKRKCMLRWALARMWQRAEKQRRQERSEPESRAEFVTSHRAESGRGKQNPEAESNKQGPVQTGGQQGNSGPEHQTRCRSTGEKTSSWWRPGE